MSTLVRAFLMLLTTFFRTRASLQIENAMLRVSRLLQAVIRDCSHPRKAVLLLAARLATRDPCTVPGSYVNRIGLGAASTLSLR